MAPIIGFTDGVYDLFHTGHLNMLQETKKRCDILIVGVHGDDVVESYKSRRPIICEDQRREIIAALRCVDKAVINRTRDKMALWELHKFNRIFIGDDWQGTERWQNFEKVLATVGVTVDYVPYTKGISSTDICRRILERGAENE